MRAIVVLLLLMNCGFAQTSVPIAVDKGQFTLLINGMHPNTVGNITVNSTLEASIRNDTAFDFLSLTFELVGYNDDGQDLRICDPLNVGLKCEFFVSAPPHPGETIQLISNTFNPSRPIPKGQRLAKAVFRVVNAAYFIKYRVETSPILNEKFTIQPTFGNKGIALDVHSLGEVIEMQWDQSSYIDEEGNASRLIKSNVRLSEKDRPQPSTVIPPGTRLQETVFPIGRIKQSSDGSLYQAGLFPEIIQNGSSAKPHLESLVGKEVKLFLRLLVNDQKQNVTIVFKVDEVGY
jgi:hypothetical protein